MIDSFYDPRVFKKTPHKSNNRQVFPKADQAFVRMANIENESCNFNIGKVYPSIGQKMRALRSCKEMSQKELAQRDNVKIDVVRNYKNGKAIPDNKIISKLEQVLVSKIRKCKYSQQKIK